MKTFQPIGRCQPSCSVFGAEEQLTGTEDGDISHDDRVPAVRGDEGVPHAFRRRAGGEEEDGVQRADQDGGPNDEPQEAFAPVAGAHDPEDQDRHRDSARGYPHDGERLTNVEQPGHDHDLLRAWVHDQVVQMATAAARGHDRSRNGQRQQLEHGEGHDPVVPSQGADLDARPKPQAGEDRSDHDDRPIQPVHGTSAIHIAPRRRGELKQEIHGPARPRPRWRTRMRGAGADRAVVATGFSGRWNGAGQD